MGQAQGILVGCDASQEWLLVPWHSFLRKHHPNLPVAFGDLGMTDEASAWCERHGHLIPASQIPPFPCPESQERGWPYAGQRWIQKGHEFRPLPQSILFRKPLLMKQSPFTRTLYLDLDCQILGSLSPLFSMRLGSARMALRKSAYSYEMESLDTGDALHIPSYNSGVVVFEKNSRLLDFWIFLLGREIGAFSNDDRLLSFAIACYEMKVGTFPAKYNWLYHWGANPRAVICHWIGEPGKVAFRLSGGKDSKLYSPEPTRCPEFL